MLLSDDVTLELGGQNSPDWVVDSNSYVLIDRLFGQLDITVFKDVNRVLHVHAVSVTTERGVRVEIPLGSITQRPVILVLKWEEVGVSLGLAEQPLVHVPWRPLPLPPRQ